MGSAIDTGRAIYNPEIQSLDRVVVTRHGDHRSVSPIKHEQAKSVNRKIN
jgi:hypothetical protein